jgi:pantoate--beta-alanine ligase
MTILVTTVPDFGPALPDGASVAFVPTMGALHHGHASLIRRAGELADKVVVSVFVNPTQFAPGEDFERYPRDLEGDVATAEAAGADIVFAPEPATVYPEDFATRVDPGPLADDLCGRRRPGHFAGVATVVVRLLGLVRPDVAVFGRKDFQQLVIIRRVTRDLALSPLIEGVATARDPDGLAASSRNRYLDRRERRHALAIPRALRACAAAFSERPILDGGLVEIAHDIVRDLDVEYLELRRASDLGPVVPGEVSVLLIAARVGNTRLIDNVIFDPEAPESALLTFPEEP